MQQATSDWDGLELEFQSFLEGVPKRTSTAAKNALVSAGAAFATDDDGKIVYGLIEAQIALAECSRGRCASQVLARLVRRSFAMWLQDLTPRSTRGASNLERHLWRAAPTIRRYLLGGIETSSLRRLYAQVFVQPLPPEDPTRAAMKRWFKALKQVGLCNSKGDIPGVQTTGGSGSGGTTYRLYPGAETTLQPVSAQI